MLEKWYIGGTLAAVGAVVLIALVGLVSGRLPVAVVEAPGAVLLFSWGMSW